MVEHVEHPFGRNEVARRIEPAHQRRQRLDAADFGPAASATTRYLLNIICPAPHNDCATLCACPS